MNKHSLIKEHFFMFKGMNQLIPYYYEHCPGSLMPLFLLFLARTCKAGKPAMRIEEKIRRPLDWKDNPEGRYSSPILSQFTQEDAEELAKRDPAGTHLLERWECNEMDHMSIILFHSGGRLQEIRTALQKHDEALGDSMDKRRALFLLVQGLLHCTPEFLKERYVTLYFTILKHANLVKYDDPDLSRFEKWLLGDVKGKVFVPFAKAPYSVALMKKADVTMESFGKDAELESIISEMLVKGNGIKSVKAFVPQKPYDSKGDDVFDVVILNEADHSKKTDFTSWHQCMKEIKGQLSDKGRFVGLIETKHLFMMVGKQKLFKEIVSDGSLESVILLPRGYDSVLISVNKAKKNPDIVKMINLFNEEFTLSNHSFYRKMIARNSRSVSLEELAQEQTSLRTYFEDSIPSLDGFNILPLGRFLKRYRKESMFGVSDMNCPDGLSQVIIDSEKPYSPFDYEVTSNRMPSFSVYEPAYYLDNDSLLVRKTGNLEARLYDGETTPAVFSGGLAFSISNEIYPPYIINELRKPYVVAQLNHWSTSKERLHSEDEILDLKIYVPEGENVKEREKDICRAELNKNILPNGEIIDDGHSHTYTIEKSLGRGGFGISYLALQGSFDDEDEELVVLKEFFSAIEDGSERFDGKRVAMSVGDIDSIRKEMDLHSFLVKFIDEGETMAYFSKFPGCRVRSARNLFKCDETNTYYYVMDYFPRGTLVDELKRNGQMSEPEFIDRVMKPVAIALDTMHRHHWLHLDVKPENVLIDNDGYAVLGDLGISQHYDTNGEKDTKGGGVGTRYWCAMQQYDMAYTQTFHPELDIYALAKMMYYVLTGDIVMNLDPNDLDSPYINISEQAKEALKLALDPDLKNTPKSVQDFIHMLPGCENQEFKDIAPREEEEDSFLEEFFKDDFDLEAFLNEIGIDDSDDLPLAE